MSVPGRFALRVAAKGDVCFSVFCRSALLCALIAVNSSADEIPADEPTDANLADTNTADAKAVAQEASTDEPAAHQVGDAQCKSTRHQHRLDAVNLPVV